MVLHHTLQYFYIDLSLNKMKREDWMEVTMNGTNNKANSQIIILFHIASEPVGSKLYKVDAVKLNSFLVDIVWWSIGIHKLYAVASMYMVEA